MFMKKLNNIRITSSKTLIFLSFVEHLVKYIIMT